MNPSLHAAARSRGSAFWDDNQPVQPALPTEFLGRPILFGDPQRWDLYYPDSNPAAGRRARRLMFNQLHGAWNLRGREIAMALLNPTHPTLREQGVHLRLQPLSVKTISATLYGLAQFANWHEQVHPDRNLGDLTDSDLDAFLVALAEQQATTNARICAIEAIRQLHQLHPVFTGGGITIEPWPGRTTASLTGRRPSPELSTPVIEPEVWWPLLRACWQYIDVFSYDILAARDEWNALDTTPPTKTRLRDATALVSQWASNPTNRVPIHRLTNGRFRAGEIHWTLLSLLISNGTSRSIFAATSNPHVRERRQLIENALQTNVLTTQPGGLTTRATSITRLDGTTGPWISGFDPATTTRQITVLRTACYIFTAALTMMRDSELLSITKDSITTYYGTPAVTANLYKKRRQPERKQWWVVEPVAQAINLAASLSETDYVFASIRGGHNIRFDRQEQIPLFLERLAELGPDAGLEPIPPAHLTPHMFRRTMAVITAQQPDGEIALGIQLKHASRRALANATTNGYAAETPAWAREFEHELQDSTATRLVASGQARTPAMTSSWLARGRIISTMGWPKPRRASRSATNAACGTSCGTSSPPCGGAPSTTASACPIKPSVFEISPMKSLPRAPCPTGANQASAETPSSPANTPPSGCQKRPTSNASSPTAEWPRTPEPSSRTNSTKSSASPGSSSHDHDQPSQTPTGHGTTPGRQTGTHGWAPHQGEPLPRGRRQPSHHEPAPSPPQRVECAGRHPNPTRSSKANSGD